ncbi:hypothetical protein L9F63_011275, partial [Diploptera punctata]
KYNIETTHGGEILSTSLSCSRVFLMKRLRLEYFYTKRIHLSLNQFTFCPISLFRLLMHFYNSLLFLKSLCSIVSIFFSTI